MKPTMRSPVFDRSFLDELAHRVSTDRKTALRILELVEAIRRDPTDGSTRVTREGVLRADHRRIAEGSESLPEIPGALARKYCGGGHGGYALYLFENAALRGQAIATTPALRAVEPFCKV